jgi:hypothetical protein
LTGTWSLWWAWRATRCRLVHERARPGGRRQEILSRAVSDATILEEVRRQSPVWTAIAEAITGPDRTGSPVSEDDPPFAWSCRPSDLLVALSADRWFTNMEMRDLRQSAVYPQDLMRRRYDPARRSRTLPRADCAAKTARSCYSW